MYLVQSLRRAAQVSPEGLVTVWGSRRRTYADLEARVARFAGALRAMHVQEGARVAILAINSDRYVELYHALPWAGIVAVPLNHRWSRAELAYALRDAGAELLILDQVFLDEGLALRHEVPELRCLVVMRDEAQDPLSGDVFDYETLVSSTPAIEPVRRDPGAPYGIFYTGGTTGEPKGVLLSTHGLWHNVMLLQREFDFRRGDTLLLALPLFHLAAGANLLALIGAAGCAAILPGFEPGAVLAMLARERAQHLALVPTMLRALIDHPDFAGTETRSLRRINYGAAPVTPALLARLRTALPHVELVQAFGQTEMSPVVSILPAACHVGEDPHGRLGSVGQAVAGTELRIIDHDGRELPRGTVGEIAARGPGTMLGYWNKPDQTAATLVDGWVRMGDAGFLDADGYLHLVDRVKDMIISGGENVYSIEVERALASHPAVSACAVIGVPDARWGERVHAVVVPHAGTTPTLAQLRDHCRTAIAGYKCPRSLDLVAALPLSAAGKILKTELRRPYWAGRGKEIA